MRSGEGMKKRSVERRDEATEFSDDDHDDYDERRAKEGGRGKKGFGMFLSCFVVMYLHILSDNPYLYVSNAILVDVKCGL